MQFKGFAFFTVLAIIQFGPSESLFAQQTGDIFYSITMKGIEKYTVEKDTLTIEIDNLRLSPRRIDLGEKDLVIKKQIKGGYEIGT